MKKVLILILTLIIAIGLYAQGYNFAASSGTFTALSGGTSPTFSGSGDDRYMGTAVNIGFTFNYWGTDYTTFAASENGWMTLGQALTSGAYTNNLATGTPRPVIAPLWDDMALAATSQFTYQSSGGVFTAEWLNVEWGYGATAGCISLQVKLYQSTNKIEFLYRQETGTLSSPSASIGLASQVSNLFVSLNGTGSSPTASWTSETASLSTKPATGQIYAFTPTGSAMSGTYTIKSTGGSYSNFSNAIKDLDVRGISGAVTFNVDPGLTFSEDCPLLIASGTSSNTITFQKATTGTNPIIRPTGTVGSTDAGITIFGGDYITFDGIDITIATGSAVEYGYYIINASAVNGAQNVTVKNCKITLNRTNTSSRGVYQYVYTTPTNATGANSNNKYQYITIENVYQGIYVTGNSTYPDLGLEISNCTIGSASANDIGNGSGTVNGIRMISVSGANVFNNEVRNLTVTGSVVVYGIYLESIQGTNNLFNNNVHDIKSTSTSTSSVIYGIRTDINSTHTCNVYNNFVSGLQHGITSASATQVIRAITVGVSGTGTGNFYYNSARIDEDAAPSSTVFYIGGSGTHNAKNNAFANFSTAGATSFRSVVFKLTGSTLNNVDYNDYYIASAGTNNNIGSFNGTSYNTLANWRTGSGKDTNSKDANPVFASTTDLHSASADLNGAGVAISTGSGDALTITTDIDGATRGTPPDIGADEFDINDQTSKAEAPTTQVTATSIASTVTTVGTAVDMFSFKVTDMGTSDGLPTRVSNIRITNANPTNGASWTANIGGLKLNDGTSDITIGTPTIAASYIDIPIATGNLTVANGTSTTITMAVYLKTTGIEDGKKLQFTIPQTGHGWTAYGTGSLFASDFGAAITSNEHTVAVSATRLTFSIAPSNVLVGISFSASVAAVDANGNVDADNTTSVTLARNSGTGTLSSVTGLTQSLAGGTRTWSDLQYNMMETFRIQADGGSLTQGVTGNIVCSNTVIVGTGTSSQTYPFDVYYGYSRNAALYTQAEIGGYFNIKQLAWQVQTAQTTNCPIKIYLKKTTATTITADTWANMISGLTPVYEGTVQFTPSSFFDIFLTTPFNYDGDNLLVLTEANYGGSGNATYPTFYYSTATNQNANQRQDTTPPTGSLAVGSSRPNIKFTLPTPKALSTIVYNQASTGYAPIGVSNIPVLRIDFPVVGTENTLYLNSIAVTSNNTADADIAEVKLYRTSNTTFATTNLLGSVDFSSGVATFNSLGYDLPTGTTYVWVAYDIDANATNDNLADAKIAVNGIDVAGTTYPSTEQSPTGFLTIKAPLAGNYDVGTAKFDQIVLNEYKAEKRFRTETRKSEQSGLVSLQTGKNPVNQKSSLTKSAPEYTPLSASIDQSVKEVQVPYYVSRDTGKEVKVPNCIRITPELQQKYGFDAGTKGAYSTLTAAVADLNSLGVGSAVSFSLTDATYNTTSGETFPILITPVIGGSSSNTVTIKPKASVTSTITGSSTTGIIVLYGCDYVTLDGSNAGSNDRSLIVENTNTSASTYVIGLFNNGGADGAKNCTIKNTNVKATGEISNAQYGIILNASGGDFDNTVITNNKIYKCRTGIQFAGVTGSITNDGQITKNIIGDTTEPITYAGIIVSYADNTLIENNDIFGNAAGNINDSQAGIGLIAEATASKIRKNYIHDFYYTGTTGYGCFGINYASDATTVTEISNNMIYAIKGDGDASSLNYSPQGIYISTGGNVQLYHNSIYLSGNCLGQGTLYDGQSACIGVATGVTLLDIRNNALQNSMGAYTGSTMDNVTYAFYSGSANTAYTDIDYNVYHFTNQTEVTEYLGYLTTARANLAAWQLATGKDGASWLGDPQFQSTTNLHVRTDVYTPVGGNAVKITSITSDIDSDIRARDAGYTGAGVKPDIGADENDFKDEEEEPLPVELSSFTATLTVDNYVNLMWVTQSETGVQGYYIYRSNNDMLADAILVSPLINAANSSEQQSYVFVDAELYEPGTYYYWLSNTDFDGTMGFHGPISVVYSPTGGVTPPIPVVTELRAIYPNPFNPTAYIPFSLAETSAVRFDIYNSRGQLIRAFSMGEKVPGHYQLQWDGKDSSGSECGTGVYFFRMNTNHDSYVRKAVLIK